MALFSKRNLNKDEIVDYAQELIEYMNECITAEMNNFIIDRLHTLNTSRISKIKKRNGTIQQEEHQEL